MAPTRTQPKSLDPIAFTSAANMTGHASPDIAGKAITDRLVGMGLAEYLDVAVWGRRVRLTDAGAEELKANWYTVPPIARL